MYFVQIKFHHHFFFDFVYQKRLKKLNFDDYYFSRRINRLAFVLLSLSVCGFLLFNIGTCSDIIIFERSNK